MNDKQNSACPQELGSVPHFIGHIVIAIGLVFIFGLLVMWLWNGMLPGLFGVKHIGYWQGVGLVLLGRLLFGTLGQHTPHPFAHHFGKHHRLHHGHWAQYNTWWQTEGQQAFDAYVARTGEGGAADLSDGEQEQK